LSASNKYLSNESSKSTNSPTTTTSVTATSTAAATSTQQDEDTTFVYNYPILDDEKRPDFYDDMFS